MTQVCPIDRSLTIERFNVSEIARTMHTVHDRFMCDDNFARLAHGSAVDVESHLRPPLWGLTKSGLNTCTGVKPRSGLREPSSTPGLMVARGRRHFPGHAHPHSHRPTLSARRRLLLLALLFLLLLLVVMSSSGSYRWLFGRSRRSDTAAAQ